MSRWSQTNPDYWDREAEKHCRETQKAADQMNFWNRRRVEEEQKYAYAVGKAAQLREQRKKADGG